MENKPTQIYVCGMELDKWEYESCIAEIGVDDDWATIYSIESKDKGKGHASHLLLKMKSYYEKEGKRFGSSIALNDNMRRLLIKYNIPEYNGDLF